MFPRGMKLNIRPALFHQAQVNPGRGQISQVTAAINRQMLIGLVLELVQLLGIVGSHPACRPDVDGLVAAFNFVFLFIYKNKGYNQRDQQVIEYQTTMMVTKIG